MAGIGGGKRQERERVEGVQTLIRREANYSSSHFLTGVLVVYCVCGRCGGRAGGTRG